MSMVQNFFAALRFLTVLPVPGSRHDSAETLAASVVFFPLVGLLVGCGAAVVAIGIEGRAPTGVAAVLLVILLVGASGGLHMDGLADTADGFFSSRPRERILEIMRDSHIGAMGVMAIFFVLALKVAALAAMDTDLAWRAVFVAPVAGRVALLLSMALLPYARPEGGLGALFYRSRRWLLACVGVVFLAGVSWFAAGPRGLTIAGGAIAAVILFAGWCRLMLGGATGDTLGASCEIAETVVLVGCSLTGG